MISSSIKFDQEKEIWPRKNQEINFLSFIPSNEDEFLIKKVLESIENIAPSNSFLTLSAKLERGQYQVRLSIHSFQKNFYSTQTALNLKDALSQIQKSVTDQIQDWKKKRVFSWNINQDHRFYRRA